MKSKRNPGPNPPAEQNGSVRQDGQHDPVDPHILPTTEGQPRRIPVNEVPAPQPVRRTASLRSRAGAIPGRGGQPQRSADARSGPTAGEPGPPANAGHAPGQTAHGYGRPGQGHAGQPGQPGYGFAPGQPGRDRRDPRRRSRHRGLKIALTVVIILLIGILGSAYVVWNSMMSNVNIVSPTDMTVPSEYNVPTESLTNPPPVEQGIINVLLLGADAREEDVIQTNTDSMMILTIDQAGKKIKITSLQRDMLVWMPGRSEPAKLNSANAYGGPALAMRVVNDTFRLNIENYVIVNMRGMEALVDIAGGVTVNVEKDEVYYVNQMIGYQNSIYRDTPPSKFIAAAGSQLLDGRQAVAFGRIRKGDSDYARMGRQRVVIQALFNRFMQAGIGTKTSMISKGLSYITTNFSKTQLTSFGLSTLPLMNGTMEQLQIPIDGYFVEDPEPVWVNRCDFNGMIPLLQKFIFGRTYPFDPVKRIPGAPNSGTKTTTGTTRETSGSTTRPTTRSTATTVTTTRLTVDTTTRHTTEPGTSATTSASTGTSGSTTSSASATTATTATTTRQTTRATTEPGATTSASTAASQANGGGETTASGTQKNAAGSAASAGSPVTLPAVP